MSVQGVLFDLDGTLSLPDAGVYREAAAWLQREYGLDPRAAARQMLAQWEDAAGKWRHLRTLADEEEFWRGYGAELAGRLGISGAAGAALMRAFPYERFAVPAGGARELLKELRARGLKIGVLSNTLPNIGAALGAIGVADLVDAALSTCVLGVHKPEPAAFELAARELGVVPEEILFVDDKPENVAAARGVGMGALLIDHAGRLPEAIHHLTGVLDHLGVSS